MEDSGTLNAARQIIVRVKPILLGGGIHDVVMSDMTGSLSTLHFQTEWWTLIA